MKASALLAIEMVEEDLVTIENRSNYLYSKYFEKFYKSHDTYLNKIYE